MQWRLPEHSAWPSRSDHVWRGRKDKGWKEKKASVLSQCPVIPATVPICGRAISPAAVPSELNTFNSEEALCEYWAMIFFPAKRKSSRRAEPSGISSFQFSCAGLASETMRIFQLGAFQLVCR